MRRAILTILLFLLLGFVTSVAVAWVAAVGYQAADRGTRELLLYGFFDRATMENRGQVRSLEEPSWTWGRVSGTPIRRDATLPSWSALNHVPPRWGSSLEELAAGWPMLCLRSVDVSPAAQEHAFERMTRGRMNVEFWLPWPNWKWEEVKSIPCAPIWAGLIVNTLFWSMIWFVLCMAPIAWRYNRSRHRVPKGLCGWCAYDLRKTPRDSVCPECGHEVQSPPRLLHMPSRIVAVIALFVLAAGMAASLLVWAYDDGIDPIHWAAYRGDIEAVRAELARGVDPNLQTDPRVTGGTVPLLLAIQQGYAEIAHVLLDAGADPNDQGAFGVPPIVLAIVSGHSDVAERLLDSGADPAAGFMAAIRSNDVALTRRIAASFEQMSLKDEILTEGLATAASSGSIDAAALLIELGAKPSGLPGTPLPIGSARDTEFISFLLDAGATFTEGTWGHGDPIGVALAAEDFELANRLLKAGFPATLNELTRAIRRDSLPSVRWLIEVGNVKSDSRAPFELLFSGWVSPTSTNRELWEYLVSIGAEVDVAHPFSNTTSLQTAVSWSESSIKYVQFLLDHGADPNQDIGDGRTCIDIARNDDIRQLLIDAANKRAAEDSKGE